MKQHIITKGKENYILVNCRWEKKDQFCDRVKNEIGETLFEKVNPQEIDGKIYVHIPFENKHRVKEAICNYSGTELSPAYFRYWGNETINTF